MLQGHTFHAFLDKSQRSDDVYVLSQFVGGMPAPMFLFLTGVTLSFLLDGRERKGIDGTGRLAAGLRRAGYLLLLAFAVRVQAWLFALPWSRIEDVLKVDILNCMGVSLALLSLTAFLTTAERIRFSLIAGFAIAVFAPVVSSISWESTNPILTAYLAPNTDVFGVFPWTAFTAFGVAFGSILRITPKPHLDRLMQWTCLFAFGTILTAGYFATIPYSIYRNSDFWLNSPALVFIKTAVILLILCFAYLWRGYGATRNFSFVTLLGTSSLLVYWVHLEIVYGRWFWFWKERLSIAESAVFSLVLIATMVLLSMAWRQRKSLSIRNVSRFRQPATTAPLPEPES